MSWNRFDPEAMERTGEKILRELENFSRYMKNMDAAVKTMSGYHQDSTSAKFQNMYRSEVKLTMEKLYKEMEGYGKLLKEAGRRYGSMIDNGNANLLR